MNETCVKRYSYFIYTDMYIMSTNGLLKLQLIYMKSSYSDMACYQLTRTTSNLQVEQNKQIQYCHYYKGCNKRSAF